MTGPLDRADAAALRRALLSRPLEPAERGIASHAAIDAGDLDLARSLAREAVAQAGPDGRLGGDVADLVGAGALVEAALLLGDDEAAQRQRWWLLRFSPRDDWGVLHRRRGSEEVGAASVYMIVPALVASGDLAPADMQYRMHREQLWDETTGLYAASVDMAARSLTGARGEASANGWVAAGVARALHLGVEADTVRERWQRETTALLEACARLSTEDGAVHAVIDDPSTAPAPAAGLMLAYAAFTGVADGWLAPSHAGRAAQWATAAIENVDTAVGEAFALLTLAARARARGR